MTPRRVLMFGHCHGVFIHPLTAHLKSRLPVAIDVLELLAPGAELRSATSPPAYDRVLSPPTMSKSAVPRTLGRSVTRDPAGALRSLRAAMADVAHQRASVRSGLHAALIEPERRRLLAGYDLYHVHYLDPTLCGYVRAVPADARVIATLWGSDLFCVAGVAAYAAQLEMLARADIVTVHSLEMRELVLAKFGRQFAPRMRLAAIPSGAFDRLDAHWGTADRAEFCATHGLRPETAIVCLGHNGFPSAQHLGAIASLARMPAAAQARMALVIPMTYGAEPAYQAAVRTAAARLACEVRVLRDFMSDEDVAQLRRLADVHIEVLETDAFSCSMREALYCENVLIAGAWLPYGELRRHGLAYRDVASIEELGGTLAEVLAELPAEKRLVAGARELMRRHYGTEPVIDRWRALYSEQLALTENHAS